MDKQQAQPARVIGVGTLEDGVNVYIVTSQTEDGRVHLVRQLPARLACDCKGYTYRNKCAHVAAVVAHKQRLQLEQAQAEELAAPIVRQMHAIAQTARELGASRGTHGATPARFGGRDQRAFSLMAR